MTISSGSPGSTRRSAATTAARVLFVSGDEAVAREVKALLGNGLTTVAVKRGLSRYSARQIPPVRARKLIEDGVVEPLKVVSRGRDWLEAWNQIWHW